MTIDAVPRVRYFQKQFLRVDEFRDEQLYQLALRRRHNITQHTWGIVSGLEIASEDDGTVVLPGMAIDGYGRELLLTAKARLAPETFDDLGTDRLDVWIVYDRRDDGSAPDGYGACDGSGRDAYRAAEKPRVLFERPRSSQVDARRPPGVPVEVLDAPLPKVSDDPNDVWRVYLGRVIRQGDQTIIDRRYRPYVGVVAETIDHPANATRVEIGGQSVPARNVGGIEFEYEDPSLRRFAVFVPDSGADPAKPVKLAPRLEVRSDDQILLRGQTIVQGNVRMHGGAVEFVGAKEVATEAALDNASMYRVKEVQDQLRIDLGVPDQVERQFVIGFSTPDGHFTPCLTIEMSDTTNTGVRTPVVRIDGDLSVTGKIVGNHIVPALTIEAMAALFASFAGGQATGNGS